MDQISALASRPILVDRQIPKPCRGLFEQVMDHCLRHMPPLSDPMPGIWDHLYILPKLLLFRGSHPNPIYNQKVKSISRNRQTALRGEWNALWQAAMDTPTPPFRRLGANDTVVGDGGLSRDTARSLDISAPKKKYLPPPRNSRIRRRNPPGPSAPPPPGDPPPGIFN